MKKILTLLLLAGPCLGATVYSNFSPGGALSGTWNSQNVNVGAGSPFITGTLPLTNFASCLSTQVLFASSASAAACSANFTWNDSTLTMNVGNASTAANIIFPGIGVVNLIKSADNSSGTNTGQITMQGGNATAVGIAGGNFNIVGGNSETTSLTSQAGGVTINGGNGGSGGAINVFSGHSFQATSGSNNDIFFLAGNTDKGEGGEIAFQTGAGGSDGVTVGPGGTMTFTAGNGASPGSAGGPINMNAGAAAASATAANGGTITITAGTGRGVGGNGGTLALGAGAGGSGANGGAVTITAKNGSTNGNGGSITLQTGLKAGTGANGLINLNGPVVSTGTTFTMSGCSATSPVGGKVAGQFTAGTTGTCTVTITFLGVSPNGWACHADDLTTPANFIGQSASTTSSCTVQGTTVSGDVIVFSAMGY